MRASTAATSSALLRACAFSSTCLVKLELLLPASVFGKLALSLLALIEYEVPDDEAVHLRAHKTGVGLFGRADDGFAAHVKGSVDHDRVIREASEGSDQIIIERD